MQTYILKAVSIQRPPFCMSCILSLIFPKKFPPGYVIELNSSEKQELVENFHRFNSLKYSTVAPHAFTEQGLYMLATILKGDLAISTTIAIIDTFTKLRKLAEIGDLRKLSREELELYDEDIKNMRDIYASGNGHRASTGGNSENEGIRRDFQAALLSEAAFFVCLYVMQIVLSLLHVFKIFMIIFFICYSSQLVYRSNSPCRWI